MTIYGVVTLIFTLEASLIYYRVIGSPAGWDLIANKSMALTLLLIFLVADIFLSWWLPRNFIRRKVI
jgi:hypothetical protein